MNPNTNDLNAGPDPLEESLRAGEKPDAATWKRIRDDLAQRAGAQGLIDVAVERHDSPLGTVLIGATSEGLVRVGLPTEDEDALLAELADRVSPKLLLASRGALTEARRQLDEYFELRRHRFEVDLDWRLTKGFRRDVLRVTAEIPYGETASYTEVAAQAGRPAAVRAAGTALATNPLPIVVPCHRVLRSGGDIGSYRGGPAVKEQLLGLEGAL